MRRGRKKTLSKPTRFSFVQRRQAIAKNKSNLLRTGRSRNPRVFKYEGAKWEDVEFGPETSVGNKEVLEFRKKIKTMFPKRIKQLDVIRHVPINQGEEGACTMIGFMNMQKLSMGPPVLTVGKKPFDPKKYVTSKRPRFRIAKKDKHQKWKYPATVPDWESTWGKCAVGGTSASIAATLDGLVRSGKIDDVSRIRYVPIKANQENYVNKTIWVDLVNKKNYKGAENLMQVQRLVEELVDKDIPVTINSNMHTRTVVGYNDNYVLCVDNRALNFTAGPPLSTIEEARSRYASSRKPVDEKTLKYSLWKGGYSVTNKDLLYNSIRELVYLDPAGK